MAARSSTAACAEWRRSGRPPCNRDGGLAAARSGLCGMSRSGNLSEGSEDGGVVMGRVRLLLLATAVVAVAAAGAASQASGARWQRETISMDFEVVVLLSECDGLIAEGGVGTIPGAPVSHAYTHNFLAMVHIEGWARWDPDLPLEATYVAHARITGTGIDAAGQTFTISGDVTSDRWHADFWADGGRVVVRRDDGSFAWGTAAGGYGIVNQPPLLYGGSSLMVTANHCQIRS